MFRVIFSVFYTNFDFCLSRLAGGANTRDKYTKQKSLPIGHNSDIVPMLDEKN